MRIKKSKRGLTFSFQENESFYAGARYRYVVDRELDEVIIIPDKDGKYQMSRKGVTHKPLVDLRNHEIREIIALARYMEVEIQEDKIVVHVIKSQVHTESLSDRELLSMARLYLFAMWTVIPVGGLKYTFNELFPNYRSELFGNKK